MKKKNLLQTMFGPKMRGRTLSFAIVIIAFIILSALKAGGSLSRLFTSMLIPVCAYIVAAVGLNLNVGFSGELNLGQAGFMAIGGFTAAVVSGALASSVPNDILRLIIAILCGSLLAGLIGWLISIPVLKLQGDYLAIVTLAFGQILMAIINNLYVGVDANGLHFSFVNDTTNLAEGGKMLISGPMGATGVKMISTFTAGFILILIALLLSFHLIYSREGRAIRACRDNRIAAETSGINVAHTKTISFVLSSALAGAGGALYMLNYSSVVATKFDFNQSIMLLVYVVLGGLGNMTGTIIATSALVVLPEVLRFLSSYRMLIYSVVLIAIMLITNNQRIRVFFARLKLKTSRKEAADNE
jgi:branched-chain amino acid transport system permease protein